MALQKSSHIFTKIVFKPLRTNLFYIVLSAFFLTIGSTQLFAQDNSTKSKSFPAKKEIKPTENKDVKPETKTDVTTITKDTIKLDSLKPQKAFLEGKVKYKAKEYARFDQKKKLITLYDGAELFYQDYELKSGIIIFDYQKNEVYAGRIKDSLGNYTQYPYFKQGSNVIEPDSIRFNYKTKKALVWNSRTTQQELNIKAEVSKKVSDSVYFMKGARITTAKDLDDPEYYFLARKVKFVPGKKVVVGFTNMYIANVPTPVALPFAFFPMTETNRSGIIVPSYGNNQTQGYSLQNGGYYLALSDKYDLTLTGDYFTNGSYAIRGATNYANKYKYSGNVNFSYENQINSERGYPDYSKTKIYNIQWSHSKDAKSNPNSRFSASVNLGSSKYFQQSISQSNYTSAINNSMNSSVSFSSTVHTIPQINYSLSATHSQNTNSQKISMTLPTLQASVDRVYPFVGKNGVKKGFIKNVNLQYSVNGRNSYDTTDDYFFKTEMFKNAKTGFEHTIPLTTNFKVFKYFNVSPSANYREVWTMSTIKRSQNFATNSPVDTKVNGFDSYRTYSFSKGLSTTLYGTYNFKKGSRIQSIRHVVKPNVSYSYSPSFDKYFTENYESNRIYSNTIESTYTNYSRFEGTVYGAPSNSISNNLGFSLSNTFEAKVTDKDSTKTEPKKISLLNNLTFNTNYNLVAKKWNTINFSGGTNLFKQKMNVNFGGTIDPYEVVEKDYYWMFQK